MNQQETKIILTPLVEKDQDNKHKAVQEKIISLQGVLEKLFQLFGVSVLSGYVSFEFIGKDFSKKQQGIEGESNNSEEQVTINIYTIQTIKDIANDLISNLQEMDPSLSIELHSNHTGEASDLNKPGKHIYNFMYTNQNE